ncbi:iron-containing alcohol dehydrogenase [Nitratireductor mangrovi]|uniref:Iron-containing alcohol dehydrogenase n=1 Tax=Nitratireductor mangrovi TaxID=2599600 RepID=A0A5B8L578_9HYPH|nr:iron-containing alcohol dehydrogenase [Nitratireductor mangrovi]QDZ03087.1 iron-containing alcohol dehydrogenase [Nitratireductor mangrovi]
MTTPTANWSIPTAVRFGCGRIAELPDALAIAGIGKPLFVTDPGLAKLPVVADTLAILDKAGIAHGVFAEVKPNPVESNLASGVDMFRKGGHDGVIAFGGGSALDLGKLIAFQARQTRPVWDFEDIGDWWTRADATAIAPIVAVPTTAGTGSEVGRAGVLTNEATHTKKVIFHPKMLPAVVIADPELTVGMPPFITAGTGMDALAHCLEAYCAPGYHPMADGIAAEGVRLVLENLPKAFADGKDIGARASMMSAAAMGATAFQKGLGAIHSLSHPIGALYDTHHGMTNAVFMPYVLAANRNAIADRIERLAAYCGIAGGFDGFATRILALRQELKIPHALGGLIQGLDMNEARKDLIAEMAIVDPTAGGNPVKLTRELARSLLEDAVSGTL